MIKKEKHKKILEMKEKILERIDETSFEEKIKQLLNSISFKKVKKINFTSNGFTCETKEENPRTIIISITDSDIYYSEEKINRVTTGIYHVEPTGKSYIKYSTIETTVYKNIYKGQKNSLYNAYNVDSQMNFYAFDKEHNEIWNLKESRDDTYYQNKITKEKILPEPDCLENYVEKEYYFREGQDFIIKKIIKKYHHPEIEEIKNEDFCLITKNSRPTDKKLYRGGYYAGIPKEMYTGYKLGECSLEQLWKSRVKRKTHTTYF